MMNTDQIVTKKKKLPWLAMAEAMMLVGGIVIIIGSCFLSWVSYTYVSNGNSYVVSYKGLDFGKTVLLQYIEVYLLPVLGVIIILAALFSAGRRRSPNPMHMKSFSTVLRALVLISGMIVMIIAFEVAYRFNPFMVSNVGLSFWDNIRIGWYATMYGGLLVIIGAAFSLGKKLRKVGFIDFWLVRQPHPDEPPVMMMPQPMYPMDQMQQPMMQQQMGQTMLCPTCGRPLEYSPEYQALYCYNCNRFP